MEFFFDTTAEVAVTVAFGLGLPVTEVVVVVDTLLTVVVPAAPFSCSRSFMVQVSIVLPKSESKEKVNKNGLDSVI